MLNPLCSCREPNNPCRALRHVLQAAVRRASWLPREELALIRRHFARPDDAVMLTAGNVPSFRPGRKILHMGNLGLLLATLKSIRSISYRSLVSDAECQAKSCQRI